jgi:transposase
MSTSLLYHAFAIRGYDYVKTDYAQGAVTFTLCQRPEHWRCAACGSRHVIGRGQVERRFRAVPIGRRPVSIALPVQRVGCLACGAVRQVEVGFADPRRSYTRAFARYALELSQHMTIKAVAAHLGISWDVIKDIQKRDLQRRFARPRLADLKQLAIDELHLGKKQGYATVVLDLESGAIVFVGEGKGAAALEPFWQRLHRSGAVIEAVAMDMSPAYLLAVQTHLPWAVVVFDHFHVIKLCNAKLSQLRRDLYREAAAAGDQGVLQGTRWLLLKNPEDLDPARDELARLEKALELNKPLATAYYLKEELRQLWAQADKAAATAFLDSWVARAQASGIGVFQSLARTLRRHEEGLLAYYDYPLSTGPLEGTNNKVRALQRQAYGYRDLEFFKLKLMALHEAKYALVG